MSPDRPLPRIQHGQPELPGISADIDFLYGACARDRLVRAIFNFRAGH